MTDGGRVLSVTSFGKDIEHAIANTYKSAALVAFEGRMFRSDIGHDLVRKPTLSRVVRRGPVSGQPVPLLRPPVEPRLEHEPVQGTEPWDQREQDDGQPAEGHEQPIEGGL